LGCFNLKVIILQAYDVFVTGKADPLNPATPVTPIEGLPPWVDSARYSIDATTDQPRSAAMMRGPMMQGVLEDRFHMKVHRESREGAVYLMTVSKAGLKLKPTKEGSCSPFDFSEALNMKPSAQTWCGLPMIARKGPVTVLDIHGIPLGTFAKLLHPDGSPVIDRTGITGVFDIHLEWETDTPNSSAPDDGAASDPSPHTSAIVATREQLGLELRPGRGTREVLVIDHMERPSGN
jgi:uncharacterized protein (TIGR03435 family)